MYEGQVTPTCLLLIASIALRRTGLRANAAKYRSGEKKTQSAGCEIHPMHCFTAKVTSTPGCCVLQHCKKSDPGSQVQAVFG